MMQVAQQNVEHRPAAQGEEHHEFHHGKAATRLLGAGLRMGFLVGGRVGQLSGRAVGALSGGAQGLFQPFLGQTQPGLDIGRIACRDGGQSPQSAQGLHLADHFATGRPGFEHLPQKAFEGQAQRKIALATVEPVLLAGQERGGQEVAELFLQLAQGGLAPGLGGAPAHSGQAGAPGRKEWRAHHRAV